MTQTIQQQYVDGFLLSVPADKVEAYRAIASKAGEIWKEHGALDYRECVGDDLEIPGLASFRTASNAREGEVVVFAWIVYESKAERDRINAAVMADPRLDCDAAKDIFDCARMACGGFNTLVHR